MASIVHDEWPSTSKSTTNCIPQPHPPTNGYVSSSSSATNNQRLPRYQHAVAQQSPNAYHHPHPPKHQTYGPPPIQYYNVTWPGQPQIHPNYVNNLANGLVSVYITPPPFPHGVELQQGHHTPHLPQVHPTFVAPPPGSYFFPSAVSTFPSPPLHVPPPPIHIVHNVPPPSHPQSQKSHGHVHNHSRHSAHHQAPPAPPVVEDNVWNNAVSAWEQRTLINNKIGLIINGTYEIVQSIDSGSYGAIFVAEDLQNGRNRVAVKFDCASKDDHLKYEFEVYKSALYEDGIEKVEGFPKVFWFGQEYGHNILAMELLGPPIASLFNFCERKFGWETILSLGEQMIRRVKHLHQRGFIHRDIKPENFLMGLNENEITCYLIDFGLARRYRYRDENRMLKHIPFRRGRSFVGTAKYASLNSHKNAELSRRDDIESLGYVLIELINGSLPWKRLKVRNAYTTKHQMYIKIKNEKEKANWNEVCPCMAQWMDYCRKLDFDVEPDYELLLNFLRTINLNKPEPALMISEDPAQQEIHQVLPSLNASRCTLCQQTLPKKSSKKKTKPLDSLSFNEAHVLEISGIKTAPVPGEQGQILEIGEFQARKLSKSASVRLVSLSEETHPITYADENTPKVEDKRLQNPSEEKPQIEVIPIIPEDERPQIQEISSSSTHEELYGAEVDER